MTWKGVGPLSLQGVAQRASKDDASEQPCLRLRVLPLAELDDMRTSGRPALLHEDDARVFRSWLGAAPAFVQRTSGGSPSDCMLAMDISACVPRGAIRVESLARRNLHVVTDEVYDFTAWEGPEAPEQLDLREITLEVRAMHHAALLTTQAQDGSDAVNGAASGGLDSACAGVPPLTLLSIPA